MKKTLAVALGAFAVVSLFLISGSAATIPVQTPTNLEVVSATEDTITIAWGPSQPGDFFVVGEPGKNKLTIGWGPSEDTRSAVTYTLKKNGTVVASGLTTNQYTVSGLTNKVKSFKVCVQAFNANNQASPETCGSYTRI